MKLSKMLIIVVLFNLVLAACGAKPTPDADGVIGAYTVQGTNPDKSTYEATLDVTAKGEAFDWSWNNGEYKGIGLQQDNIVTVAWGGDACYAVSYIVGADGILTGKWTDMSASGIGADIATPADKSKMNGIEGLYNATGKNPDGSEYGCSLQVTKKAEGVYEWYWFNCGEYTGVAIQNNNIVSVAYGASECSVMAYIVNADSSMDATWTYVGQTDLGTESVTPK